jgi:ESCRT-II complex subunit VPS36
MFSKLRLPVRVKTFKSGLVVVMDSSATEEVIERNLLRFITTVKTGVTALQIGGKFNWSVGVAAELLQVRP